jgi:excisionase family DNA binding protein
MISQPHNKAQLTLLSLTKVADLLDVSLSTIRRLIKEGALRARRVGGQLRVSLADLQVFIEQSVQHPSSSEHPLVLLDTKKLHRINTDYYLKGLIPALCAI